ncbi:hypothetical protein [Duganella sp. BuS-21]|uniref:hypothetical protein n=1 Tax=Duganella sp. BuS-21 TaxID=2943848 RepID=UPI0035A5C2E4
MLLSVGGTVVARSHSPESIMLELQIRAVRELWLEDKFSTILPTSPRTLTSAAEVDFAEPMAALKLIAACSAMGEVPTFPMPERRARPRAETPLRELAA